MRANFPHIPVYTDSNEWPQALDVDVIYGNPPCSPWSSLGKSLTGGKDNWQTDPNTGFTRQHFSMLAKHDPKIWVTESVPQAATHGRAMLQDMAEQARVAGYAATLCFIDVKFLGMAQQRRRVFFVLHRIEVDFVPPDKQPRPLGDLLSEFEPYGGRSPGYVFESKLQSLFPQIPEGGTLRQVWEREGKPGRWRPRFVDHRLYWDRPSGTVFGYVPPAFIHPKLDRYLGVNELSMLCGFPDDFQWRADWKLPKKHLEMTDDQLAEAVAQREAHNTILQIAKTVTPPAADWLAENLANSVAANRPIEKPYFRVIDYRAKTARIVVSTRQELVTYA
jgi:site-specific DNA-cytosine methylase